MNRKIGPFSDTLQKKNSKKIKIGAETKEAFFSVSYWSSQVELLAILEKLWLWIAFASNSGPLFLRGCFLKENTQPENFNTP